MELDLCYPRHGMWLDRLENLKLAPADVAELFGLLLEHCDSARQRQADKMSCPRCNTTLTQSFDVVRSGRYITYRCAKDHSRFSAFSSFMIEKGFVRLLTKAEIDNIATRVAAIHYRSRSAPVDLRKHHARLHCRSALSLLDPNAAEKALQGYAKATAGFATIKAPKLADALVAMERDRQRALREQKTHRGSVFTQEVPDIDIWTFSVAMVAKILD